MISQDELKALLEYDPETGVFKYRKRSGTRSAGAVAGSKSKSIGYVLIGVGGKQRVAHRLAWLYMTVVS